MRDAMLAVLCGSIPSDVRYDRTESTIRVICNGLAIVSRPARSYNMRVNHPYYQRLYDLNVELTYDEHEDVRFCSAALSPLFSRFSLFALLAPRGAASANGGTVKERGGGLPPA